MLDSPHGARRPTCPRGYANPPRALGLTDRRPPRDVPDVLITARLLDEAALRQNRMGRAPFVVPAEGHEACQIGTAWAMRRGIDVWLPYYRDTASCWPRG